MITLDGQWPSIITRAQSAARGSRDNFFGSAGNRARFTTSTGQGVSKRVAIMFFALG